MRVELLGFFNLVSSAISKLFYLKMIIVNLLTLFSLNHHKLFTMTPIYANLKKFSPLPIILYRQSPYESSSL